MGFVEHKGMRYNLDFLKQHSEGRVLLYYSPAIADVIIHLRDKYGATWDSIGVCVGEAHGTSAPRPSTVSAWYHKRKEQKNAT